MVNVQNILSWYKELTWVLNVCQVQIEVIQKRQKEKKAMMSAVKKYQKGDFFIYFFKL